MAPTNDPAIVARLEAYGPYAYHRPSIWWRWTGLPSEIEWERPAGFENDLALISVALWFPAKRVSAEQSLPPLLDAMDEFRQRLAERIAALRAHLIHRYRATFEEPIDDASIVRQVRSLHLRFDGTASALARLGWLNVAWDEERGLDVAWSATGELIAQ